MEGFLTIQIMFCYVIKKSAKKCGHNNFVHAPMRTIHRAEPDLPSPSPPSPTSPSPCIWPWLPGRPMLIVTPSSSSSPGIACVCVLARVCVLLWPQLNTTPNHHNTAFYIATAVLIFSNYKIDHYRLLMLLLLIMIFTLLNTFKRSLPFKTAVVRYFTIIF